jgi:hypothetical protein
MTTDLQSIPQPYTAEEWKAYVLYMNDGDPNGEFEPCEDGGFGEDLQTFYNAYRMGKERILREIAEVRKPIP